MELDQALRYLGNFGRYQTLLFFLLNIIASIFTTLQLIGMVFVSYTPRPYYCTPPEGFYVNETVPVILEDEGGGEAIYDRCHMYVVEDDEVTENVTTCQFGWDFETVRGEQSVVTDVSIHIMSVAAPDSERRWTLAPPPAKKKKKKNCSFPCFLPNLTMMSIKENVTFECIK